MSNKPNRSFYMDNAAEHVELTHKLAHGNYHVISKEIRDRWAEAGNTTSLPTEKMDSIWYRVLYERGRYPTIKLATADFFSVADPAKWSGEFLTTPGFDLSQGQAPAFAYPSWPEEKRKDFLAAYPGTHIPYSAWGEYLPVMPGFDYEKNPSHLLKCSNEIKAAGKIWCFFLISDAFGSRQPMDFDNALAWVDRIVPIVDDEHVCYCLGWEQNEIDGAGESNPTAWTWDDFKTLDFMKHLRSKLPLRRRTYLHFTPNWWGGSGWVNGILGAGYADEDEYWEAMTEWAEVSGFLFQSKWRESEDKKLESALYIAENKQNFKNGHPQFVWFEQTRNHEEHGRLISRFQEAGFNDYC